MKTITLNLMANAGESIEDLTERLFAQFSSALQECAPNEMFTLSFSPGDGESVDDPEFQQSLREFTEALRVAGIQGYVKTRDDGAISIQDFRNFADVRTAAAIAASPNSVARNRLLSLLKPNSRREALTDQTQNENESN